MKNPHRILSALLISSILLAGCKAAFTPQSTSLDAPAQPGVSGTQSELEPPGEDDSRAQIVTGEIATLEIDQHLGNVNFAVDQTLTVLADYPANGSAVLLTLTDNAGFTWQLNVPGNALDQPQTLKMTALSGVVNSELPGLLTSGIMLEPDGLQFFQPATLVVTGNKLGSQPFLLTGDQIGSKLALALPDEHQASSALIYHFSTIFSGGASEEAQARQFVDKLNDAEKAVVAEARNLLKDKDIRVPEPPSLPIECTDETKEKEDAQNLESFINTVRNPEHQLIQNLLAIKRNKALLGETYDEAFSLELRLLYRLEKKVRLLLKTYYGKPEKLLAVSKAALSITHDIQLLGGSQSSKGTFFEEIANWCDQSIDQLINDIVEKHDYKKADAVWKVAKWAAILGVNNTTVGQIQAKLQGALSFQVKNKLDLHYPGQDWLLESELEMKYNQAVIGNDLWLGQGAGNYVSYSGDSSVPMQASPFTVNVKLKDFDICSGTANFEVDRFYSNTETYQYDEEEADGKVDLPLVKNSYDTLFSDYLRGGLFTFPVKVHNLDANMVDESISGNAPGSGGKVSGEFGITVIHTPKHNK